MDTRFSIAIHLLILISESDTPISSSKMAASVGTNPSFVRKVLGSLKKAGLIVSHQGRTGFSLAKPPKEITLIDVYRALYGDRNCLFFEMHRKPNDKCLVGRYIHSTLGSVLSNAQKEAEHALASTTLENCIEDIKENAEMTGDLEP